MGGTNKKQREQRLPRGYAVNLVLSGSSMATSQITAALLVVAGWLRQVGHAFACSRWFSITPATPTDQRAAFR
jgi:hypothetical protein